MLHELHPCNFLRFLAKIVLEGHNSGLGHTMTEHLSKPLIVVLPLIPWMECWESRDRDNAAAVVRFLSISRKVKGDLYSRSAVLTPSWRTGRGFMLESKAELNKLDKVCQTFYN